MKRLSIPCVALALIWAAPPVMAEVFEISVEVDAATAGDLELIESTLDGIEDDEEAGRSMRRLMNNVASDLIDLSSDRLTDEGDLTLDDDSVVYLMDDDEIAVKPKHLGRAYPSIRMCRFTDNSSKKHKRLHRRACRFDLFKPDGTYVRHPIPAGKGCRGPNPYSGHMLCKDPHPL